MHGNSGMVENSRILEGLEAFLMVFWISQMTLDIETVHVNQCDLPKYQNQFSLCVPQSTLYISNGHSTVPKPILQTGSGQD